MEKPRYLLANEKALFDNLLALLQTENEEVVGKVWEIIESLPKNEEYAEKLDNLELQDTNVQCWTAYLGFEKEHDSSLIAYVTLILSIDLNSTLKSEEEMNAYQSKFIEKKGFQFVISSFTQTLKQPKSKINTKCLIYCLKVINSLLDQTNVNQYFTTLEEEKAIWSDVWNLLNRICEKHAKNFEDKTMDENEEAELIANCLNLHIILVTGNPLEFSKVFNFSEYLLPLKSGVFNYFNF